MNLLGTQLEESIKIIWEGQGKKENKTSWASIPYGCNDVPNWATGNRGSHNWLVLLFIYAEPKADCTCLVPSLCHRLSVYIWLMRWPETEPPHPSCQGISGRSKHSLIWHSCQTPATLQECCLKNRKQLPRSRNQNWAPAKHYTLLFHHPLGLCTCSVRLCDHRSPSS